MATLLSIAAGLMGEGKYEEAIVLMDKVCEEQKDHAGPLVNRATALAMCDRLDEALIDLNKAEKLAPNLSVIYVNRAALYQRLMQRDEEKARKLSAEKQTEKKQTKTETVVEPGPKFSQGWTPDTGDSKSTLLSEARDKMSKGQWDEAIKTLTTILDFNSTDIGALINRASCNVMIGKFKAALRDLDVACEENPNLPQIYLNKAQVYDAMGDNEAAGVERRRALKLQK